nr:uncharacterized protein LOC117687652 [Crassostrea gigas]
MRRQGDCGINEAETFRKYETMHLKIIVAILCLSLVLVQAGGYGQGAPRSAILKHIRTRVEVIHHHKRGSGSNSNSSNKKSGSSGSRSSGSREKKRYRRSAESLENTSSLED